MAWLAPLPPGVITKSSPSTVSPGCGSRGASPTRSMLALPTTTIRGAMASGRPRRVAVAVPVHDQRHAERLGQVAGGHHLAEQAGRDDRALAQQHPVGE